MQNTPDIRFAKLDTSVKALGLKLALPQTILFESTDGTQVEVTVRQIPSQQNCPESMKQTEPLARPQID